MPGEIPLHLQKYIVNQKSDQYTTKDHSLWRFTMRQLISFLKENAHNSYLEGLDKTGIEIEEIPSIESINSKLNDFDWGAIPVSGFIPPTAFMEFQSLGYLPIASDIRNSDNLLYTPAPDIIHEAAGHAPIIVNEEFSSYLKMYANIASKALLNEGDIKLYEAIRELSDLKEHPNSTEADIKKSEENLDYVSKNMGPPSEAALLGRMNWWTAEYGLILQDNKLKIFGAGLLSSLGESENCLKDKIKKIPITLDCINYTYDITEEQPQLFVAESFQQLENILSQFSDTMAYNMGGSSSVQKAILAKTINTVELNSHVQISGLIEKQINLGGQCIFVKTIGPTQLSFNNKELRGHDKTFHKDGYSTIIDTINNHCLSQMSRDELANINILENQNCTLSFDHGFQVSGNIKDIVFVDRRPILIKFTDCSVTYNNETYFKPEWGDFDLSLGSKVTSVFSGAADSQNYGELYNFTVQKIPKRNFSEQDKDSFEFYGDIKELRSEANPSSEKLGELVNTFIEKFNNEWLAGIELLELAHLTNTTALKAPLVNHLNSLSALSNDNKICIDKGLRLCDQIKLSS